MGNKLKKLIMFLVVVLGMTLFANEEQKAPNEIIKDNPEREVTTVESMKVRDHATMSLSVTKKNEKVIEGELDGDRLKVKLPVKGINENTLDRMAKPKEGKRLVVEAKSKINPRMAKMATKDIKKMPTQEEMNNLTVKQIQAMMSNTTGEKEEESQSKNIKNHIAMETDKGVTVDILDVNKNEDIYVNVEENGEVIDRYRVAIANNATPRNSVGNNLTGYLTTKVSQLGSSSIRLARDDFFTSGTQMYNIKYATYGENFRSMSFYDDFLGRRTINFNLNSDGTTQGKMGIVLRIRPSGVVNQLFPVVVQNYRNPSRPDSHLDTKGSSNESYTTMVLKAGISGTSYGNYYQTGSGSPFFTLINGKKLKSFKVVHLREESLENSNLYKVSYLKKPVFTGVAFDLEPATVGSVNIPGVYTIGPNQSASANIYVEDYTTSHTISAKDIVIDVGDQEIDFGSKIADWAQKKYTKEDLETPNDWTLLPDQSAEISFMRKTNSGALDKLGLFLEVNGELTQIARYDDSNTNNYYTKIYKQPTSNGGTLDQKVQLRVSQNNNEWAKVEYKIQNAGDIKNPPSGNPEFIFYIIQGRKMNDGRISELRRVKYTLKFSRIANSIGNITTTIDPRLNQLTNHWITLGGNASTDLGNFLTNSKYAQLIGSTPKFTADKWIASISKVKKGNENYTSLGSYNKYERYGKNNTPYLAIKNIKSDAGYMIGTTELTSGNNFARKIADTGTLKIEVRAKNGDDISFDHIMNEAGKDLNKADFTNTEGYKGTGTVTLTGKTLNQEYTLTRGNWGSIAANEIELQNHTGYATIFAGLVNSAENLAYKYKVSIDGQELGEQIFGPNNNWISTKDGTLQIKLVKNTDINDKRNIKLKKLKDDDFSKELKIEYYHSSGIKLGQYILTVKNTRTVTPTGTLTTTIDPRLANYGEGNDEWVTLGGAGGTTLANLSSGKYSNLISATTNALSPPKTIKEFVKVYKGSENYNSMDDTSGYKRYALNGIPKVAILKTLTGNDEIAYTRDLEKTNNFVRKIGDKGEITFEFKAGDNYYYSFKHNLVKASDPSGEPGKFTAKDGYIGETSVDLSRKEIDKIYTLARSEANTNSYEIDISKTTSGWMPTLHGLFDKSQYIVDHYKVNSGNTIEFGNTNTGVDITENGATLFNIKLIKPTDTQDKKNVQIIKKKDVDFSKTVKIEYYHSSGIKLGEFTVNVSNRKTVTSIGSMSTNIDPRLAQKSTEWISLAGYGHGNIGELETDRYSEFIGITSSTISEEDKKRTIISVNEVKKGNAKYVEIQNTSDNKAYARYGTNASTPLLGIKKKNTTSTNNDNIGTNISDLTGTDFFARKISDTGEVSVEFVATNKNNYIFTHDLISYTKPNTTEYDQTNNYYIGSGKLNLWTAKLNKEYTLTTEAETDTKLTLNSISGTLPKLTGILPRYNNQIIADKYKVTVNGEGTSVAMKSLGTAFSILNGKVEITLNNTTSDNLIVKKLSDESFAETTILVEYYHDNGIKLGQYTLKLSNTGSETDYGILTTKVDPRFVQYDERNYSNLWISSGGIANSNLTDTSLSPLIGILKTTRDTSTPKNIKEIISIKDESNNIYSEETGAGEYPYRYKKANDYLVAIKSDKTENIGIENFVTNNLIARKYKDNDAGTLTINFRAKDNSRGVFYHKFELLNGPTKEFTADGGYTGSGTVDFTGRSNSTYTLKDSGAGNNEITVNGNGHLPVINGMIDEDSLLATHYKVNSGAEVEITQTSSVANGSYTLSFDTTTFTTKLQKNNDNTVNTPITIEYLYKKNNKTIKLGSYILTINNTKTEDIGTQTVNIDGRMATSKNGHWILTDGKVVSSYSIEDIDDVTKYDKMISISDFANEYFTSSNTPSKVEVVGYRELSPNTPLGWVNNEKYGRVVFNKSGSYVLVTLPKNKTPMNKYRNELAVNLDNSSSNGARNPYTFILTVDGKRYKGTVNAREDNTHSITGNATLDLTGVSKGTSDTWASKTTGRGTSDKMSLVFSNGKTLFDMGSYGGTQITNKFSYKIGNNSTQSIDNTTSDIDLNNSGVADIRVAFVDDGLQITKLSNEIINGVTVTITPKYNDITLGVLNLTVTNTAETLGNITVAVDRRLAQIKATDWVGADGNLYDNTGLFGNYSNLIKAEDGISNTVDSYKVIDIEAINTTLNKDLINADGNRASYKYYDDKNKNILALPYNTTNHTVTLGHYNVDNDSLIVVSKKDIESTTRSKRSTDLTVTNSFMLTARTTGAQPEDKLYTGNVIEKYVGKESYSGSGNIDLGNSTIDKPYIFKTTVSNGNIESNDSNIKIAGASDDPVNSLDIFGDGTNIANKLTVEFTTNGNTRQSRTTTLASNTLEVTEHNLSVGIDTTDGGLTLTRKGGSDVTKAIITYYYDPQETGEVSTKAVTLGTFILNITNANPVTDLGTLTTVIDPRLGNLKNSNGENVAEKEWLTLDGYTGTNLDSSMENKHLKLISMTTGTLTPVNISKIISVFKEQEEYKLINGGSNNYNRYGKDPMPYVAIRKKSSGSSLNTNDLTSDKNFARKVSDIGAVTVEAEGKLNQRYSFKHDLTTTPIPILGYEPSKGYVGTGSIDLGNTPISENYYILVPKTTKSFKNSNSEEEIQLDSSTGTLPNLTGLVKEYRNQVIASKYTVTINSESEGQKQDLGTEVDIVTNQVKIKLESGTDGKQLKIKKLTDEDVTPTMVKIKYYHESGIQLGEYDLTISNSSTATSNGTITTEVDPRFIQVDSKYKSYWLATNDIVGNNLESANLIHNMSGIIKSTLPSGISTISEVIEIKNSKSEIYKKVTGKVNGYTKYYIDNEGSGQNFAVRLGSGIQIGGTIARKYSDNENGDLTVKYIDGSGATATKKSFTHKLKLVEELDTNFTPSNGYLGSGTVDLSNKGVGKYRIVKPHEPSPPANNLTDLEVGSYSGHFPVLTGLVTQDVIATHYSVDGGANYIALNQEADIEANKLKITLDGNGDIILERMGSEKITKNSVTIDYFYFSDKGNTSSTKIKLGSFTLNINDSIFELEPDNQALDFGNMFYDSRDGLETHETRVQKFTMKNPDNKNVTFSIKDDKTTGEMSNTSNPQNKVQLKDISVEKESNTEFKLQATAVLDKNTKPGSYEGTIEVIVDIVTPSNP